jgi:alpha-galactosidase
MPRGSYCLNRGKHGSLLFAAALVAVSFSTAFAIQDGTARTPPMGWNSWNFYGCRLSEQIVLDQAGAFVKKHKANWEGQQISLQDAGYQYVNMDDCWHGSRDAVGNPLPDEAQFSHGLKWLADSLHRMGLKIGIYSCAGTNTCAGRFAGYNYEERDAKAYAAWGMDYLKYDWCNVPNPISSGESDMARAPVLYSKMSHALRNSGRDIVFSLCEWGANKPWLWADSCGHLWRTTGDINASWGSIVGIVDQQISNELYKYARPGSWADPDMLEVGNGSLTAAENRAHFDLWCIQAAPLILGNDLPNMTEDVFTIVTNREVIAVDQDSLGVMGRRVRQQGKIDVFVKLLASPDTVGQRRIAVVLFNRGTTPVQGTVSWGDIGETDQSAKYTVRDLWAHKVKDSVAAGSFAANMLPHGTTHLLLTRNPPPVKTIAPNAAVSLLPSRLATRISAGGLQAYIPVAGCKVRIFDIRGRQVHAFVAAAPSWYALSGVASFNGTGVIRVETATGILQEKIVSVK